MVHVKQGSDSELLVVGILMDATDFGENVEVRRREGGAGRLGTFFFSPNGGKESKQALFKILSKASRKTLDRENIGNHILMFSLGVFFVTVPEQ